MTKNTFSLVAGLLSAATLSLAACSDAPSTLDEPAVSETNEATAAAPERLSRPLATAAEAPPRKLSGAPDQMPSAAPTEAGNPAPRDASAPAGLSAIRAARAHVGLKPLPGHVERPRAPRSEATVEALRRLRRAARRPPRARVRDHLAMERWEARQ